MPRPYSNRRLAQIAAGGEMVILCFEHNDRKLLKGEDYLDVIDANELGRYMVGELKKIPHKEDGK